MIQSKDLLIISVKPEYARKILKGEKTIELRKCAPKKAGKDDYILIYVTAPVKELWGIYKIENIIKEKPITLWENFGEKTGITKQEFNNYFKENKNAFGIQLQEVKNLFKHSIKLDNLKNLIPGFMPPQTYSYIDSNLINYSSLKELIS
ncbi:ASCH domain-containing protein [Tamlana sp. 2201CG12-4]|uniref:ASCH domain-containing protein n=1 Tax=Tamlana sp. 2201CG12-4 TaxID=3112582 RepID=UPI002DBE67B0|nr:ASCH domain-containing protein [Tamlana sp. 2201CG12-4]MEC3905539.1 ASCH domain-containing protein [Tamlana sp. 2201CG12-4]